jgi:hypothetical protein
VEEHSFPSSSSRVSSPNSEENFFVQEILKTGCGLIWISKKTTNIFLEDCLRFEGARNSHNSDFDKSWGLCFLFLGQNNPCLKFEVQSFSSLSEEGSKEARKSFISRVCFVGKGFEGGEVVATGERIRSSFLSFVFEL